MIRDKTKKINNQQKDHFWKSVYNWNI